jgi:hypothetical protein
MTKVKPLNIENTILDKLNKIDKIDNISITTSITCSICIDDIDIKDNENIKTLNCSSKHIFHIICIDNWLKVNNICPLCREEIKNNKKIEVNNTIQNNNLTCFSCCSCIIFFGFIVGFIYFIIYGITRK